MKITTLLACSALLASTALVACGDSTDSTATTSSTSGTAGSGGATSSGGGDGGSTTSSGTAGAGGATSSGGGAGGGTADFWGGEQYDANGTPNPAGGNHHADDNCLQCHDGNGNAPHWLFGGTMHQSDGTTAAPNVQVGVRDPNGLYTAYSATNGNFWFPDPGGVTIDWANAEARARNGNGEVNMNGSPMEACNTCHTGGNALTEP